MKNIHEARQWIIGGKDPEELEKAKNFLNESMSGGSSSSKAGTNTWTLLSVAIEYNNIQAVKKLLQLGFDLKSEPNWNKLSEDKKEINALLIKHQTDLITNMTAALALTSQKTENKEKKPLELHLYKVNPQKARAVEHEVQQYVVTRFFRRGTGMLPDAPSHKIYERLLEVDKVKSNEKTPEKLVTSPIVLDGYNPRSVIIALSAFLNDKRYLPEAVYQIGNTYIHCKNASTHAQHGNVLLQVIAKTGRNIFTPSVYGDGDGDPRKSIYQRLEEITNANGNENIHGVLNMYRTPINDIGNQLGIHNTHFCNQLNFLRSVIEVARYAYKTSNLYNMPIAVSQARTSMLLVSKKINSAGAYGVDAHEKFYKKHVSSHVATGTGTAKIVTDVQKYKSPYGAVTGIDLRNEGKEVKNKIDRINEKYSERYKDDNDEPWVEGCRALKASLIREYGDGNESESGKSDYSDAEAPEVAQNATKKSLK